MCVFIDGVFVYSVCVCVCVCGCGCDPPVQLRLIVTGFQTSREFQVSEIETGIKSCMKQDTIFSHNTIIPTIYNSTFIKPCDFHGAESEKDRGLAGYDALRLLDMSVDCFLRCGRFLSGTFGPKILETNLRCRKFHNEDEMVWTVSKHGRDEM